MDDLNAVADELAELVARGDTSSETVSRAVDALSSDAAWYEENPYYDGLNACGGTVELWQRARDLI